MQWWVWVVVAVVVLAIVVGGFAFIQAKRRSSGVIVGGDKGRRGSS